MALINVVINDFKRVQFFDEICLKMKFSSVNFLEMIKVCYVDFLFRSLIKNLGNS